MKTLRDLRRSTKYFIQNNASIRSILQPLVKKREHWLRARSDRMQAGYVHAVIGGELTLRLSNIPGVFSLPATSDLARRIIFDGCYEPDVTSALCRYLGFGGTIVNVGANVGLISAFLALECKKADRIVAIEPNPEAFRFLVENIKTNNIGDRVEPINICIGAEKKSVDFYYIVGKPEYSSVNGIVHSSVIREEKTKTSIPQLTLDEVVKSSFITLIFVDVEGAEELVFRGAEKILAKQHPELFFECSDMLLRKFGCTSRGLEDYLRGLGYQVRNAINPRYALTHPFEGEAIAIYA